MTFGARVASILLLVVVLVCQAYVELPPLPNGETEVTEEFEGVVTVKWAEAFHRLSLEPGSVPLSLLHILRISRRTGIGDLRIIATIGPNQQRCTLILHEEPPSDNQRLDITCRDRKYQVIQGAPLRRRADYELTDEEAAMLDARVTAGFEQLKHK